MKSIRNCDNYSNLLRVNLILLHVWLHLKYFLKTLSLWLFPSWDRLTPRPPCTNWRRWPAWISSSILSFNAWHSSVVCPLFLWYWNLRVRSTFLGLATFLGGVSTWRLGPHPGSSPYWHSRGYTSWTSSPGCLYAYPSTRSWSVLMLFLILPLISTGLRLRLSFELSQLLQLHKFGGSPPKLV